MKENISDQLKKLGLISKNVERKTKIIPEKLPINEDSFNRGKILTMPFEESDGIVTKGYSDRIKYFIVLGVSNNDSIIGAFFINSNVNENVISTHELLSCQFPLKQKDYPKLLNHNSNLDCSDLIEVSKIKILSKGFEIGQLTDSDLSLVVDHVEKSEVITPKLKKKFGIEDKS